MATSSPFSLTPPAWAADEIRKRIVLLLNHVLMQENEAMSRLSRKKGQVALVKWRDIAIKFIVTPAGLLDVAPADAGAHLTLQVVQQSPLDILQVFLKGDKPEIRIEGDVQLAAEVNWLVDHVRWDVEEDLARIIGDVPARAVGQAARRLGDAINRFAQPKQPASAAAPSEAGGKAP